MKTKYNQLLIVLNKTQRRYINLYKANRNHNRRLILLKRIKRLIFELNNLRLKIETSLRKKNIASAIIGAGITNTVSAQTNFAPPVQNPFSLTPVVVAGADNGAKMSFVDIDNDGDFDMFSGHDFGDFYFYENTGSSTSPVFANPILNPFGITQITGGYSFPTFADLDNDGDYDMLSASDDYYPNALIYFENTGNSNSPSFGPKQINPFSLSPPADYLAPTFIDIDNDGDFDVFSGSYGGNFYYIENVGTISSPAFAPTQTNPFSLVNLSYYSSCAFADMDNDGDFDLYSAFYDNSTYEMDIAYIENIGSASFPMFASPVNPTNPNPSIVYTTSTALVDIDNDGDFDLFTGGYSDVNIYYFENLDQVGLNEIDGEKAISVFPNPTDEYIEISGDYLSGVSVLKIKNSIGEVVLEPTDLKVDVSSLSAGVYFIHVIDKEANVHVANFVKK